MDKGEIAGRLFLGIFSAAFFALATWAVASMVMMSESYNYSGHKLVLQQDLDTVKEAIRVNKHEFNILSSPISSTTEYGDEYVGIHYHFYSRNPNILDLKCSEDSPGGVALMGIPLLLASGLGTVFAIGAIKRCVWNGDKKSAEGS